MSYVRSLTLALLLKALRPTCFMCVRIIEQTTASIQQEASCGIGSSVLSSLEKWYKVSRHRGLVDTFNHKPIRRKIHVYQLYEAKEHMTAKKLLVQQDFMSQFSNNEILCNSQYRPFYKRIYCLLRREHHYYNY